jgi:hypothetical protein
VRAEWKDRGVPRQHAGAALTDKLSRTSLFGRVRGEVGGVKNRLQALDFFSYQLNDGESAKWLLDYECPDLAAERKKPIRSAAHAALR